MTRHSDEGSNLVDEARLAELFEVAIRLPPEEREAFVDAETSDDDALREELRSLLETAATAPHFLDELARSVLGDALRAFDRDEVPSGTRIGPYEVVAPVGSGGMGVVYRAHDAALDRPVALKLLHAGAARGPEARNALVEEGRAASGLDHPGIAVVYQVGTTDEAGEPGRPWLAMAFYDGETLAERMRRGPPSVEQVVRWGGDLADALAHAHERGVLHRDVKPANVMLTDGGEVKLLDFGVAAILDETDGRSGPSGTPPYMSPERLRGEDPTAGDDIWALGVVLFEMLAGRRPFTGASTDETIAAILAAERSTLRGLAPTVPEALARVVEGCLAGEPSARYGTAAELRDELRAIPLGGTPARPPDRTRDRPGMVVLPFLNISADPDNEYLSDGLTEEVITRLARVRALRVISRTSTMRLKGVVRTPAELAAELGVRYVLEGSVRSVGRTVRVSAQLVDADHDEIVWSLATGGREEEVLDLQEAVARGVVDALALRLSPAENRAVSARPIDDWRAYESFLRARYEAWRFTAESLEKARRYMDDAIEIVGENALLLSTLGHITAMSIETGLGGPEALDRIEELAERVFRIDPDSPRGHWLMAFTAMNRGDTAEALAAGRRALDLAPDDPDVLLLLGYVEARIGAAGRARALFRRAVEIDPLTPLTQCMPGFIEVLEGRHEEAIAAYRTLYRMDPDSPFAAVTLGWVLAQGEKTAEAVDVLERAATTFAGTPFASWAASMAAGLSGDRTRARAAVDPGFEAAASGSEMFARALGECLALAGDAEGALRWLGRAVDLGLLHEGFLERHDRLIASIRQEDGFEDLTARVRLESLRLSDTLPLTTRER